MDNPLALMLIVTLASMVGTVLGIFLKEAGTSLFYRWRSYRLLKKYSDRAPDRSDTATSLHRLRTYSAVEFPRRPNTFRSGEDAESEIDEEDAHEIPAFLRRQAESDEGREALHIPAFLRREEVDRDNDTRRLIQNELSNLSPGIVLFNPPAVVTVGISERIEVRIASKPLESMLENLKGRGARKTEAIKISDLMKVTLTGSAFLINARSSEEQLIGNSDYTEWSWDLVPLKAGPQTLNLKITVSIVLPGIKEQRDHPVMEKNILVKSNIRYSVNEFGAKNWQWIAGTLLIPVAIYLWKALSGGA